MLLFRFEFTANVVFILDFHVVDKGLYQEGERLWTEEESPKFWCAQR